MSAYAIAKAAVARRGATAAKKETTTTTTTYDKVTKKKLNGTYSCEQETARAAEKCELVENTTNACFIVDEQESKEKAPAAQAFGFTFILAPSFCLKIGKEDGFLLSAFTQHAGLAVIVHSELRPSERVSELLRHEHNQSAEPETLLGADALLGVGAQRLLAEPNAGGASRISEAFSMEVLSRAFGAVLLKTEMEIFYFPTSGSITDFQVELEGTALGVSVTRAMCGPAKAFDEDAARNLLTKKLGGVIRSTETCCGAWEKQILHVWAPNIQAADALNAAYASLPYSLISDTVVLVTACEGLTCLFDEKATKVERAPKLLKGAKEAAHLRVLVESDPCAANRCPLVTQSM